jgi:hypothetical protein
MAMSRKDTPEKDLQNLIMQNEQAQTTSFREKPTEP